MITIVRHVQSIENATKYTGFYQNPRQYSGEEAHRLSRDDVDLTDLGLGQGEWLRDTLDGALQQEPAIYTSTYLRAKKTALLVLGKTGLTAVETADLDEQHYGDATYMTKDELFAAYPDCVSDRQHRKHLWVPPGLGGESLNSMVEGRLQAFIDRSVGLHDDGQDVIAFTHHTTIMGLRSILENRPVEDVVAETRRKKIPNGGFLQYMPSNDGFARIALITPPENLLNV